MSGNADDPLLSVAGKISDGVPVDWKELQDQIATPDQAAVAEELRSLERYARVNEAIPASWGRFQIIEQIGVGTFGVVYRALDPTLQIEVALKVTRPRQPELAAEQDKALDEARRLVKVKHHNVVRVFGAERVGDEIGLSMELVGGQTLDEIIRQTGAVQRERSDAHRRRSLSGAGRRARRRNPSRRHQSVQRDARGRWPDVLMDFGTGRDLKRQPSGPGGDFAGTPSIWPPKSLRAAVARWQSEIYSVGVLLYFLVTGSYPVDGDSRTEIGQLHDQRDAAGPCVT